MLNEKRIRIAGFLAIALGWSFLWFSQKGQLNELRERIPLALSFSFSLVPTFGLLFGSLFMRRHLPDRRMSIYGTKARYSFIILVIPVICLTILGVENDFYVSPPLFGFLIGLLVVLYALGEEFGWRGYLQEEFWDKKSRWAGFVVIGTAWWLWHWFFLRPGNDPKLILLPLLILASAGIGEVAIRTRSVLICTALHCLANILFMYPVIANGLSGTEKVIALAVCLTVWIPLILRFKPTTAAVPAR